MAPPWSEGRPEGKATGCEGEGKYPRAGSGCASPGAVRRGEGETGEGHHANKTPAAAFSA